MNNRLKFKALYEGELHQVYKLSLSDNQVTIGLKRFPFIQDVTPEALLQWTGRKDVNGIDVYEGDYNKDGDCVVWCNECNGWQFGGYDAESNQIYQNCHRCDGDFDFQEAIEDFEYFGNIFLEACR